MSLTNEYESYDALGLAELVRKGDTSPEELLEGAMARVEEGNPRLNAVVIKMYEEAQQTLRSGLPEGPLQGVPFLLKDLSLYYAGTPLTNGCRLFAGFVPDHDSEIVARYRRAGLVVFGKTASPEFGLTTTTESTLYGQTMNPWSLEHTAGGSSGGSAAAVASGMVPAAHASDGGGSIRIPASCCGLFGLKPTRARVPLGPDVGEGWSGMSTAHAITRSVRDSAALLDIVAGPELGDPYCAPPPTRPFLEEVGQNPGRLRIAYTAQALNGAETHPDCAAALEEAVGLCTELGHEVEAGSPVLDKDALRDAIRVVVSANVRVTVEDRAETLGRPFTAEDLEPITYAMVSQDPPATAAQYARSIRVLHAQGRALARFLEGYDVLLTPTLATPPLPLGVLALTTTDIEEYLRRLQQTVGFTQLMNVAGNPAMSVPLSWNAQGLPIGVQFAGRFGDEATLLRLASQLEKARPWVGRRPL